MSSSIPQYSLKQVTRNTATMFHMLEVKGEVNKIPSVFLQPHRKDYYVLMFVEQGSSRHWVDMIPYTLQANTCYFSAPDQLYMQEETQPLYGKILSFTREFLITNASKAIQQLPLLRQQIYGHELRLTEPEVVSMNAQLGALLDEYSQKDEWWESMVHARLVTLLISLSRNYQRQYAPLEMGKDRQFFDRFRDLLNEQHTQIHDVASYASQLHVSPGHLGKVIRQQTGKSAIDHIHERLALEAKRLLFHSDQSMKEIAFALGFVDASYFNRFFKKLTGKTPLAYRTQTRQEVIDSL